MTTRTCTKCNENKPLEKFNKFFRKGKEYREHTCMACRQKIWRSNPDNLAKGIRRTKDWVENNRDYVKRSKRERDLKRLYGITGSEYEALLVKQNHECQICTTKHTEDRYLHVDHCHSTGKVRGLLCTKCNTGLGLFNEDANLMQEAMYYLFRGE